jgi:hypothetical protein
MTGFPSQYADACVYVNVINIHIEPTMTLAAHLNDIGKPAWIGLTVVSFIAVLAARLGGSRISDRESKDGMLGTWRWRTLAAAYGTDAAAHGENAG